MQVLMLIRHAVAADRSQWHGDDSRRPLTKVGATQAARIAHYACDAINREHVHLDVVGFRTSPAVRCVDTVKPLAEALGIEPVIDRALMEGSVIKPPSARAPGVHILCAHGDNIPWMLDELSIDWDGRCKKGSIWTIVRDAEGRVVDSAYYDVGKK